ncbi:uncharacterized protein BX664DRAFT_349417 [Halteromyces radiatus]|uniref:uncharacterized protein n=1 Tax=Halteromyces radiatus TaxID=101107 RepID=UPI00221E82FD|nr:uncharacterized protein BX664DRAFT_349417 [Halteromyces radiatus]KAI8088988.1 hypothetical protein BX664DRAFT_349417 [Halteromyces radiatus]
MYKLPTCEEFIEWKLRRLLIQNQGLKAQLEISRIPVSEASQTLIHYCINTYDPLLSSIWGSVEDDSFINKYKWKCCIL